MRNRNVSGLRLSLLTVLSFSAVVVFESLAAAQSPAATSRGESTAVAAHAPDWSGVWIIPEPRFIEAFMAEADPRNPRAPALSAENLKKLQAYNSRRLSGQDPPGIEPPRTNTEKCLPNGMPAMMTDPVATEFLFTPGRLTVLSEQGPTIRRIYIDPKLRPRDEGEVTFAGTSFGHWEGQTLVVETTEISSHTTVIATVRTSGQAQVTERMHLKDPKHLQIDTVVTDPGALRSPWHYSRIYDRLNSGMREDYCLDNNRDVNGGEPDLTPPPK